MKITEIEYSRRFFFNSVESIKIGMKAELNDIEDGKLSLDTLVNIVNAEGKYRVEVLKNENNPH